MRKKDVDGITNIVDPDQTAPKEQPDLGLHCSDLSVLILRIFRVI